ncbi:MAG: hypothetical protein K0R77_449 [Chryseobacterium sp.]|jgi:hypothetical protein|uniref:hypothetical protein n=1 Tax=Chryseobacterium sp. TaxID=1871047 RepID=UPI00262D874E|nr:hypothetical protein [Chryseobacterium sp.]MDF2551174.1 hypothetical protein [Chryseobacterium sp.]
MTNKIKNFENYQVYFIHCNEENNQIYIYYKKEGFHSQNMIDVFCGKTESLLYKIEIPQINFNIVTDLKFNIETQEFVICYFEKIAIHNLSGNLICLSNIDGVISSKYYNKNEILLEIYEPSSNRSLGLFNTKDRTLKKYELESIGHYNRNFTIEKTNNLLFGLCNAYENRMYLHLLDLKKDSLKIICESGLYCHRDEIENAYIEINSLGDEYIFVANDDYEKMTVCIYNIYDQKKPLREIRIGKEKSPMLHLLLDKYLVIEYEDKFGILDLQIKDSLYNTSSNTFKFFDKDVKIKLATLKKEGIIVYIFNNELQVYKISDEPLEITEERILKMKEFIDRVWNYEFLMADIDEFY